MTTKTVSEADMKTNSNRDSRLVFYTNEKIKAIVIKEAQRQGVTISTLLRKQLRKTISQNDWAQ